MDEFSEKDGDNIEIEEMEGDQEFIQEVGFKDKLGQYLGRFSKRQKAVGVILITTAIILILAIFILIPLTSTEKYTRYYYIQAEEITWNYTPQGRNVVEDRDFDLYEQQYTTQQNNRIGSNYKKARFIGYIDDNFETPLESIDAEAHLGLLGPIIRAQVGDTLIIKVSNTLDKDISFFISGLLDEDHPTGAVVPSGSIISFNITISETDGPSATGFSSIPYSYYSTYDVVTDFNTGLAGAVVITKEGAGGEDAIPEDVDFEAFLMASTFDENLSYYIEDNINQYLLFNSSTDTAAFYESNRKYSFNGYLYGNMPMIELYENQRVRWYILSLGEGTHTLSWSGQTILSNNERLGSMVVIPGTSQVADMIPLKSEQILRVDSYGVDFANGMTTLYTVS